MSALLPPTPTIAVLLAVGGVLVAVSGKAELRRRWVVWVVAAGVVFAAAHLSHGMLALAGVLVVVGGFEYARLVATSVTQRLALFAVILAPVAVAQWPPAYASSGTLLGLVVVSTSPLLFRLTVGRPSLAARAGCGVALIGLPLAALAEIPPSWAVPALAAVSVADVAAWVGGRTVGRHGWFARPISRWSPNKTRGGALFALVAGGAVLVVFGAWWLAPLVPISGLWGDLRESRVKRTVGVKDAGTWLPGFGGLLDRIDSVLGAAVGITATLLVQYAVVAAAFAVSGGTA